MRRAVLKFLFVRRIRLLIFFSNGCGAKDVFWGELGVGVLGELFALQRRGGLASAAADAVARRRRVKRQRRAR